MPPNVLIVMSDEHAPMFSGPYGHGMVRTPHMDRLAAEGVTFANAYCNAPLCVPSRMSFLTGRYASRLGVFDNASPLRSDVPTYAHLARAAGYDVALAGQQHFVGPDRLHGFQCQLARDIASDLTSKAADWRAGVGPEAEPWTGPYEAGPGTSAYNLADDEVADAAISWLREPARLEKPWVLCASFLAPHFPLVVPEQFWNLYPLDEIDMPNSPQTPLHEQHPVHQRMRRILGLSEYPDEVIRRARAAYYGLISYVDEKIGQLLAALDQTGRADDTLVIYTSDHGEMNGEHGLWRKSNFYEQSVRVPLQMRWPNELPAGRSVGEVVSLVDVTASVITVTAQEAVAPVDGDDLLPLARGEANGWKNDAYAEYLAHGVIRPMLMLRSGRYKLNVSQGDPDQLFDLDDDPDERTDLGQHPGFAGTRSKLRRQLQRYADLDELEQQVLQSQRERMTILRSSGWTPAITDEESRRQAHVDRSIAIPGVPASTTDVTGD